MASQITRISNDLRTQALTPSTVASVASTLYTNWTAAGMVFSPAAAATITAILHRHYDIGMQSLDMSLAAAEIDRNQQGIRVVTDQVGGG